MKKIIKSIKYILGFIGSILAVFGIGTIVKTVNDKQTEKKKDEVKEYEKEVEDITNNINDNAESLIDKCSRANERKRQGR